MNLEPIVEYCMNEEEARAYQIGLLWEEISQKMFPNIPKWRVSHYPKKGDPRKSSLFKYCFNMQRETRNILNPKDYKYFIAAQLAIFKSIEINGQHPMISPSCLRGDKAWVRWKVWKNKFENINKSKTVDDVEVSRMELNEIKNELLKTSNFMSRYISEEQFELAAKDVERNIVLGKISGFYAALSPWVGKYCDLTEIDLGFYKHNLSPEAEVYFKEIFAREF